MVQHLRNSATGEQIVFRQRAADTAGELLEVDWCFPRGGSVPPHVHRYQEEAFEILSGRAWFRVSGRRSEASQGEGLTVPVEQSIAGCGCANSIAFHAATPYS
jgi:quercetin dioxygenase-like cupin family protein